MRSRYSAFATGAVDHLVRTLAVEHPDRARGMEVLVQELRAAKHARRLLGLQILDRSEDGPCARGATAQVLFYVRAFAKGHDGSFVELSDFVHDGIGWRYRDGVLRPAQGGVTAGTTVESLTIARFVGFSPEPS